MSLKDKKIVVGLTGGIACYKVPYLIRSLIKSGAEVRVVMTAAATKFITPLTLESVSNHPVAVEMFPESEYVATRHIELASWADLFVVAPATANFIGKVASGVSDDLLTTIICATMHPVMIVPAMNQNMWANPITQKNFKYLKSLGYLSVGPASGEMAEPGHAGWGRMTEPDEIFEAVSAHFSKSKKKARQGQKGAKNKKILITAGPTREAIDPVRYLTNHSSGKMGYALAQAAVEMGYDVTLVSGPTSLVPPEGVKLIHITTTAELSRVVSREFKKCDALIMAAAPADFSPASNSDKKIKRGESDLYLRLKPTQDILKKLSTQKKKSQIVVGFALETDNGVKNARRKLSDKKLDMIVLNQPGPDSGFNTDSNRITILQPRKRPKTIDVAPKSEVARILLDKLSSMF